MKSPFLYIIIISLLSVNGCNDGFDVFPEIGFAVFNTDAQAMLECGPFDVEIYINNNSIGKISEPSAEDPKPDCKNSKSTVKWRHEIGKYSYTAKGDCGSYLEWSGEFEIFPDSCTQVFLDIVDCNISKN